MSSLSDTFRTNNVNLTYSYIEKMMRWFKRRGLKKVESGVEVLLPGEWIPNYDFDEVEVMLLARRGRRSS